MTRRLEPDLREAILSYTCICLYMYLLTQLSIFDAVRNPKQIRQTQKIFECRKFFGNNNRSGTSANEKDDRKVLYNFLIFAEKIT